MIGAPKFLSPRALLASLFFFYSLETASLAGKKGKKEGVESAHLHNGVSSTNRKPQRHETREKKIVINRASV